MADPVDAAEFLKEAIRGALIEAGIGLLGARIDQIADLALDAITDHPEMALNACGWTVYREPTAPDGEIEVYAVPDMVEV